MAAKSPTDWLIRVQIEDGWGWLTACSALRRWIAVTEPIRINANNINAKITNIKNTNAKNKSHRIL